MQSVIISSARQTGFQPGKYAGRDTGRYDAVDVDIPTVEPARPRSMPQERRSSEARANAQALHIGIAAQMWSTQPTNDDVLVLPLPPVARMAARYASTAQGHQAVSMGFARTA